MNKNKRSIKITDTTLRDGHQSLWATRMRTDDILPIIEKIDRVGYYSVEVWGGATFDVSLRYLGEDPWERIYAIKKHIKFTPMQMLLRGQNIVGYRNYPDDVLEAFVVKSIEGGIKIFRVFDALDDIRNLEKAIEIIKKYKAHVQGNICYTISPVHTIEKYLNCVKQQYNLGIDSLNIKDMAGILAPHTAYCLIKAIKEELPGLHIQLHCHSSSGMASATYVKAIEADVDAIDCAVAPLALYTSQPAVESIIAILDDMGISHGLRMDLIEEIAEYFEKVAEKRALVRKKQSMIDTSVIIHQIPGGMASNLITQLEEQNALPKLEKVLKEIPRVREELGWPPLVTPTSQIVGTQSVFNVLYGRYKIIPQETKDYVKGYYGRPPGEIDKEILRKVLGDEKPIWDKRPADLLSSGLKEAEARLPKEFIDKEEDIISFALFPRQALDFFKYRKYPDKYPSPQEKDILSRPKEEGVICEDMIKEVVKILDEVGLEEVEVCQAGKKIKIKKLTRDYFEAIEDRGEGKSYVEKVEKEEKKEDYDSFYKVVAPLKGTFYRKSSPDAMPYVNEGDYVEPQQTLALIEAMKLFNEIKAEVEGRIYKILAEDNSIVNEGEVLFLIDRVK